MSVLRRRKDGIGPTEKFRIKDEEHPVSADDVIAVARRETPRRLNAYFVEIEVDDFHLSNCSGAIRTTQSFDTGVAVRALRALGFEVVSLQDSDKA